MKDDWKFQRFLDRDGRATYFARQILKLSQDDFELLMIKDRLIPGTMVKEVYQRVVEIYRKDLEISRKEG